MTDTHGKEHPSRQKLNYWRRALPGVMYPVAAAAPTNAPRVKAPRPLPRTAWTAAETAVLTTPLVCPE